MALDRRTIMVCRPAFAAAANEACKQHDALGGDQTFTVPLRLRNDATNTIRAYWCSWALSSTDVTALRTYLRNKGATTAEATVVTVAQKGTFTPSPTARLYVFDARDDTGWTPQEVLDALGLDTLAQPVLA